MSYIKNYPAPVNRDLLFDEFVQAGVQVNFAENYIEVTDATPQAAVDTIITNHVATNSTNNQLEVSFIDAIRPILRNWHKGTQTTTQALASAQTVLDAHLSHKTVMNTVVWPSTRLIVNPLADVTIGNISGNANAEAAYLMALFHYATRVQAWRELA